MLFFNVLADATEENSKLGAQAIDVAHRTHDGLLNAVGVGRILPNPVKSLTDGMFDANKNLVLGAGSTTAGILRTVGGALGSRQGNSHQSPEHEKHDNMNKTHIGYGSNSKQDSDDDEEGGDHGEEDGPPAGASMGYHGPVPDHPDPRDHHFEFDPHHSLSHMVDLRSHCPPVYNQGHMMSCTAHAVAGAFEFSVMKQHLPEFSPSRLFIWYNARAKSGIHDAVKKNIGCTLRNAIKSVDPKQNGVCSEIDWSYEVCEYDEKTKYFVPNAKARQKPPVYAQKHAHQHTAIKYRRFPTDNLAHLPVELMQSLDKGVPFVFGMNHCDVLKDSSMEDNGWVPKKPTAKQLKDNTHTHSLMAVGYIKEEKLFIIRNSWGAHWGDNGHFYMPFKLLNLCYDFWSIQVVGPGHK